MSKICIVQIGGSQMMNYFRNFIIVFLFITGVINSSFAGQKLEFFHSISDLPLMYGFKENENTAIIFEKLDGRIIETSAVGSVSQAKLEKFYVEILPELGWQEVEKNLYKREGELLNIKFSSNSKVTTIYVTITPDKG